MDLADLSWVGSAPTIARSVGTWDASGRNHSRKLDVRSGTSLSYFVPEKYLLD